MNKTFMRMIVIGNGMWASALLQILLQRAGADFADEGVFATWALGGLISFLAIVLYGSGSESA